MSNGASLGGSVELQLGELRPARIGLGLVLVLGILVEVLPADRAQAAAVLAADDLRGSGERERVARPGAQVELVLRDVGRAQVLVAAGLVDLARVDLDGRARRPRGSACTGPWSAASKRSRSE